MVKKLNEWLNVVFSTFSINSIHLIYIKIILQAKSHNIGTNSNICMQTGEQFCTIYLTSRDWKRYCKRWNFLLTQIFLQFNSNGIWHKKGLNLNLLSRSDRLLMVWSEINEYINIFNIFNIFHRTFVCC